MSTENMGKSVELLERRMKQLGMCDTQDVKRFGEVHQQVIEGVKSLSVYECEDDIDALKSNVNKVRDMVMGTEEDAPSNHPNSRTSTERNTPSFAERSNCDRDRHDTDLDCLLNSVDNDANCSLSSGDTLLCSGDEKLDKCSNCDGADGTDSHNTGGDFNGSCSDNCAERSSEYVESGGRLATNIRAGLVMSPISLTQDMPVAVAGGGNGNRFSKVLENIPQPLLYIPTTKQLVAGGNGQGCTRSGAGMPQKLPRDGSASTEDFCNGSDMGSCNGDPEMFESNRYFSPESHPQDFAFGHGDGFGPKDMDQITLNSVEGLLPHIHSADSFHKMSTDASSLSSISTGTDFSVSAMSLGEDYLGAESKSVSLETEDMGFMEVNLHSRNSYEKSHNPLQDLEGNDKDAKGKRKGLGGLFSRSLFFRKPKEPLQPGWKLFGKVPPKSAPEKDPAQISHEFQAKHRTSIPGASGTTPPKGKKQDIEVMSTTALILENRPMNLPSKSPEETEKHRQEYEAMVEAAKKKEQREMKLKKKHLQMQRRHEDKLVAAAKIWNSDILPNWESMRQSKKARELWWQGLPPNVRGRVWQLAIGNDLNITEDLYEICVSRAEDRIKMTQMESKETPEKSENAVKVQSSAPSACKESSVKVIKLDVARTFPQLCIFQKGGPYYDLLHRILGAYACYRPDVGYVQGMSFLAAVLLLNMEVSDAFICFANLLNRPCQVAFFRMDSGAMAAYYRTFLEFFRENLPSLEEHFANINITPDLYIIEWIFLIFSKSLPFDVACRIWDVFCRDEEEFLFRTALGVLRMYEKVLIQLDFIHAAQFLTKLPEDIQADELFRNIEAVHMTIDKRRFYQVLATHKDLRES